MGTISTEWKDPSLRYDPDPARARKMRDDRLRERLGRMVRRNHVVTGKGVQERHMISQVDPEALDQLLVEMGTATDEDPFSDLIEAMIDQLPADVIGSVQVVAIPSPLVEKIGERFLAAFNRRPERQSLQPTDLVRMCSLENLCELSAPHAKKVSNRRALIVTSKRETGFTLAHAHREIFRCHGDSIAGLVLVTATANSVPVPFPVFAVKNLEVQSYSPAKCPVCLQIKRNKRR